MSAFKDFFMKRIVYIISDGTGITAENLASSLLSQFDSIEFIKKSFPYVDSLEKAHHIKEEIDHTAQTHQAAPLVFMTLVNPTLSHILKSANAAVFDLFNAFLSPLEHELDVKSSYTVGKTHGLGNKDAYNQRIEAINFALAHDDGTKVKGYENADIILVGVSRSGKTPSCLYMALQFGILAANYPFTEDDLDHLTLPSFLIPVRHKLFGLTIDPTRLAQIRSERRPDSRYASIAQCEMEVFEVEKLFKAEGIPYINSTTYSIEEITTRILNQAQLKRRF
jgi:regulator of PEP synthase PpsR (kinase-PPPase family)